MGECCCSLGSGFVVREYCSHVGTLKWAGWHKELPRETTVLLNKEVPYRTTSSSKYDKCECP